MRNEDAGESKTGTKAAPKYKEEGGETIGSMVHRAVGSPWKKFLTILWSVAFATVSEQYVSWVWGTVDKPKTGIILFASAITVLVWGGAIYLISGGSGGTSGPSRSDPESAHPTSPATTPASSPTTSPVIATAPSTQTANKLPINRANPGRSFQLLRENVGNWKRGDVFTEYEFRMTHHAEIPSHQNPDDYFEDALERLIKIQAIRVVG